MIAHIIASRFERESQDADTLLSVLTDGTDDFLGDERRHVVVGVDDMAQDLCVESCRPRHGIQCVGVLGQAIAPISTAGIDV